MKNSWIPALKWGGIYALLMMIWPLLESILGFHNSWLEYHVLFTSVKYLPALLIFYRSLTAARHRQGKNPFPYSKAFVAGLRTTACASVLTPIAMAVSLQFLTPHFLSTMETFMVQEQWMTVEAAANYFKFSTYLIQWSVATPAVGLMLTAITAVFAMRQR
jgi:hypothetical protein